jgi:hypothetical protein
MVRSFPLGCLHQGRKGHEEASIGSHQISKQALFLPLIAETPRALRDLGAKTISRTAARPAAASAEASAVAPYLESLTFSVQRSAFDVRS